MTKEAPNPNAGMPRGETTTTLRADSLRASSFDIHSTFVIRHSSLKRRRRGLTLLEVLLAISIGTLVLSTLYAALHFHLRVVGTRQHEIEEAQLARALLRRIADDVRGAVLYNPPDTSQLMSLAGASSGSSSGAGGGGPSGGPSTADAAAAVEEFESQSIAPPTVPGLYGGPDWLQVDVSRLPRPDQYMELVETQASGGPLDRLSDVKTVTYYVETPSSGTFASGAAGLVRVELDRAVSRWADQNGALDLSGITPIAPEVQQIAFRYHDGVEGNDWVEEWDSDERGALPVAIEIALHVIAPSKRPSSGASSSLSATSAALVEEEGQIYRLVVHLPDRRAGDVPEETDTEGGEVLP